MTFAFNLEFIAFTFDLIGKILIGIAVIMVHKKVIKENKIDKKVLKTMKKEKTLSLLGIFLMIIGYLIHII